TCTTQAPHCDVSQPTCVPVRPWCSRRKRTSSVRSSTVCDTFRPFTTIETSAMYLLPFCWRITLAWHECRDYLTAWKSPLLVQIGNAGVLRALDSRFFLHLPAPFFDMLDGRVCHCCRG